MSFEAGMDKSTGRTKLIRCDCGKAFLTQPLMERQQGFEDGYAEAKQDLEESYKKGLDQNKKREAELLVLVEEYSKNENNDDSTSEKGV